MVSSAGEGGCRTRERQVVEAHVEEEPEAGVDLLEDRFGDHGLPVGEFQAGQHLGGLADRELAHVVHRVAVDAHRQRQRVEPRPAALGAGHLAHVALDLLPGAVALAVLVPAPQVRHDALEVRRVDPVATEAVLVADLHPVVDAALQQEPLLPRRQRPPGSRRVDVLVLGHGGDEPLEVAVVAARPGGDGTLLEAEVPVRHDQFRVHLEDCAEAVAVAARPVGAVEGEVSGGQLLEGLAVAGTGEVLAEDDGLRLDRLAVLVDLLGPWHDLDLGDPLGQGEGRLHRLGEAAFDAVAQDQPVDDHLDGVLLVAGQVHVVGEFVQLAVDDGPAEALRGEVGQEGVVGALAAAHHRRQHLEAGARLHLQDPVHDLLRGLADQPLPRLRVVWDADSCVEQTQVVVDLGDRADRRTRVARGALLVDGDRRREALDEVDVRLVHLAEELPGVGRERLDVAPLALGVDGVKGQRRLARAGDAGEDDQVVAGQVEVDVAQVVLARPAHHQSFGHGGEPTGSPRSAPDPRPLRSGVLGEVAEFPAELADLVPEAGGVLEAQVAGGLLHLLLEGAQ